MAKKNRSFGFRPEGRWRNRHGQIIGGQPITHAKSSFKQNQRKEMQ